MNTLILHPTETCQWYALINEAQATTRLVLDENTESYLVFLLMRYSQNSKLIESIVALDFLESAHASRHRQVELLRDIGDKSLLFCGLFPGLARKRHVSIDYFCDMGQAAYLSAGALGLGQFTELFQVLGSKFRSLKEILQAMRGESGPFVNSCLGLLSKNIHLN